MFLAPTIKQPKENQLFGPTCRFSGEKNAPARNAPHNGGLVTLRNVEFQQKKYKI